MATLAITDDPDGVTIDATVVLKEGVTTIKSATFTNLSNAWATFEIALSEAEAATIGNYADVNVTVSGTESGSGGARRLLLSTVELETPVRPPAQSISVPVASLTGSAHAPAVVSGAVAIPVPAVVATWTVQAPSVVTGGPQTIAVPAADAL